MSFEPYVNNGGTCLAVSGKDYCIVAGDSRLSKGYSILSRNVPKLFQLTDKVVLATSGMLADAITLRKVLQHRIEMYKHQHGKAPNVYALNRLLSNLLYYKRFFPYYTFNLLAGVDEEGKGVVFNYDAIGSDELVSGSVSGTGSTLMRSFLDNQVDQKNMFGALPRDLSFEEAKELVKDSFNSAGNCCRFFHPI
eukprot:TRINITY_DN596_c0_g4_i3.p1 TRINITY_DN596_c0_g4~~TRINITY_DN596_c0_g4_i3.p1  ORF type:complete len:194 (-),score=35.83 TRINITY_DN596_c0_g4_i3:757-1338(-)